MENIIIGFVDELKALFDKYEIKEIRTDSISKIGYNNENKFEISSVHFVGMNETKTYLNYK